MRRKIALGLVLALGVIIAGAAGAITVTTFNIVDLIGVTTAPPNPTSSKGRLYYDSGAKALKCLNPDGTSCATGGGGTPGGSAGDAQFNVGGTTFGNAAGVFAGSVVSVNGSTGLVSVTSGTGADVNITGTRFLLLNGSSIGVSSQPGGHVTINNSFNTGEVDLGNSANPVVLAGSATFTEAVADACALTPGSVTQRQVTSSPDTILSCDRGQSVLYNSASSVAVTLPQIGVATGFSNGYNFRVSNQNTGAVTITPTSTTINGNATLVVNEGQNCWITPASAGTAYAADCNEPQAVAGTGISLTRGVHSLTITNTLSFASPGPIGGTTPSTGVFTPGVTLGVAGATSGVITMAGSTSGTLTITAPAVAGTASNAIAFSNAISTGSQGVTAGTLTSTGSVFSAAGSFIGGTATSGMRFPANGRLAFNNNANASDGLTRVTFGTEASANPALCFDGSTATVSTCDGAGTNANGIFSSAVYKTNANCSSSGGTCGAAAAGAVSIAASATTVTVATTAVTANSDITITENSSTTMGTRLGVTCNTTTGRVYTVSTLTAATSFVITASAAPSTNPACLTFKVVN